MEPHQADAPDLIGRVLGEFVGGLHGVVVADHVVGKGHHAHAGELNAAGRDAPIGGVGQAPVGPMTVRVQDAGEGPIPFVQRTIEIPRDVEAGIGLEHHFFDGVILVFDLVGNLRLQSAPAGQGVKPAVDQYVAANAVGVANPIVGGTERRESPEGVEIAHLRPALVGGGEISCGGRQLNFRGCE